MPRSKSAEEALSSAATRKQTVKGDGIDTDKLFLERLGRATKLARIMRGLSQRELAAAVGVSQNLVWLIEQGRKDPGILLLKRLAGALALPIEFFLVVIFGPREESAAEARVTFRDSQESFAALAEELLRQLEATGDSPKQPQQTGNPKTKRTKTKH